MKRILIKRNKQFLSSRYNMSYLGKGSFQRMTQHNVYFTKDDTFMIKRCRYVWRWFYSGDWISEIFDTIKTDKLDEISQIDQEMGLYD